jgi:hypothetical protein
MAVALFVAWRLRDRRAAVRLSLAIAGGVGTACLIWAVTVGLFLGALFEPWPFSLRQGPDTAFSRACFADLAGGTPPEDVTGIYCRREWGFGGDDILSIRFAYRRAETIEAIVTTFQRVPASGRDEVRYLSGPGWWPAKDMLQAGEVYQRRRAFLWVDVKAMEAYYQHANF